MEIYYSQLEKTQYSTSGSHQTERDSVHSTDTMVLSGQSLAIVRRFLFVSPGNTADVVAKSKYIVSGAADSTMKLWDIQLGKCLYTWDFLTAVKCVAWRLVLFGFLQEKLRC
jgi:WD40 repeat protein